MTTQIIAARQKSARIATKAVHRDGEARRAQQPVELFPGLNDLSDFLEAFPLEVIRHFTLLREVEAKCTTSTNLLATMIPQFLAMSVQDSAREALLADIRRVITDLLPCFEEKIHVAGSAMEAVARHIERLDADYERIARGGEIPDAVIYGPANHPALIGDGSRDDKAQTQASSRSESRRVAIAAKRAAQQADEHNDTTSKKPPRATPVGGASNGTKHNHHTEDNGLEAAIPAPKRRKAASNSADKKDIPAAAIPQLALPSPRVVPENSRAASPVRPGTPSNSQSRRGGRTTARSNTRRGPAGVGSAAGGSATGPAIVALKADPHSSSNDPESEPVYCYCQQVSYGEMVACDGPDCKREWFHLPCVGLSAPPKGSWFCNECAVKYGKRSKTKN
ncbi:uncharacterized protein V2V93DRAFT_362493 [Kockiozyma suomiensis]|uniref:uncharacterized protein n=1 Tax=Kockiozyma suomiensis TaxID=1337062 RepID=UPI0033440856